MAGPADGDMYGLSNRFAVEVGGVSLGRWAQCQGLGVTFEPFAYMEGGMYEMVRYLPGQIKYNAIKLTRAMSKDQSKSVKDWLSKRADEYNSIEGNLAYSDLTANIKLFDAHGDEVMSWDLRGVHPQSWSGPTFDAGAAKVATETLELVHEGFL
jgi:phage tail-like protein